MDVRDVMNKPVSHSDAIMDIIPPAVPTQPPFDIVLVIFLAGIAVLVLAWLAWRRYRSPRAVAARRLKALHTACREQRMAPRDVAYQLASVLRLALRQPYLHGDMFTASSDEAKVRWTSFKDRLDNARYAAASCDSATAQALCQEARYLLGVLR